jgi:hypothetical protein
VGIDKSSWRIATCLSRYAIFWLSAVFISQLEDTFLNGRRSARGVGEAPA